MLSKNQSNNANQAAPLAGLECASGSQIKFDECRFVFKLLENASVPRQMVDVGAHYGSSLRDFAAAGWDVLAFEPDPHNRKHLMQHSAVKTGNVKVEAIALGDRDGEVVPFFGSPESTGISGLSAFRDTHEKVAEVPIARLETVLESNKIRKVGFLKIDVEGFELSVLQGLNFGTVKPEVVLAEFENAKTESHGYSTDDLAKLLLDQGYDVFVSEWWPIVRYGAKHSWRRFVPYPCETDPQSWGNLLAFARPMSTKAMEVALGQSLYRPDGKLFFADAEDAPAAAKPAASKAGTKTSVKIANLSEAMKAQAEKRKALRAAGQSTVEPAQDVIAQNHPAAAPSAASASVGGQVFDLVKWAAKSLKRRPFGLGGLMIWGALALAGAAAYFEPLRLQLGLGAGAMAGVYLGYVAVAYVKYRLMSLMQEQNRSVEERYRSLARIRDDIQTVREEIRHSEQRWQQDQSRADQDNLSRLQQIQAVLADMDDSIRKEQSEQLKAVSARIDQIGVQADRSNAVAEERTKVIIEALESALDDRASTLEQTVHDSTTNLQDDLTARAQAIEELRADVEREREELNAAIAQLGDIMHQQGANEARALEDIDERVGRMRAELDKSSEKLSSLDANLSDVSTGLDTQAKRLAHLNSSNAAEARIHQRFLTPEDARKFEENWGEKLGLPMQRRKLSYVAHKICLLEDESDGRLATTIHAAMLRLLLLQSLKSKDVEILEIGALFGIGSAILHKFAGNALGRVSLTLLDPLEGYYGMDANDPQTGVPITEETLRANMQRQGIPDADYRLIKHMSMDQAAYEKAADRQYDYLLIDGDHSYDGVARDFELYGPLVKPGGIVVFDDYGTDDWPAIQEYVDKEVRPLDDWVWLGSGWRTAAFRRKLNAPDPRGTKAAAKRAAPRKAATARKSPAPRKSASTRKAKNAK